jgi:hypothetical protein
MLAAHKQTRLKLKRNDWNQEKTCCNCRQQVVTRLHDGCIVTSAVHAVHPVAPPEATGYAVALREAPAQKPRSPLAAPPEPVSIDGEVIFHVTLSVVYGESLMIFTGWCDNDCDVYG